MLLEDSTSERRGRNFADCIFAIPLQEKDSYKEMFLGGQSGFPTNASLVTAADLMKLHLVKSNMRRTFALFASPPQRLRDATQDLCANIHFPEFWCGCTAKLIKINEIEGVNFKCIELFIKSNGMCDRVSWLNIQFWRELIFLASWRSLLSYLIFCPLSQVTWWSVWEPLFLWSVTNTGSIWVVEGENVLSLIHSSRF